MSTLPALTKVSADDVLDVVKSCLEAINTPLSLGISMRIENNVPELPQVHPASYLDAYSYSCDAQALALVSKSEFFNGPPVEGKGGLKESAINDFMLCEARCKVANAKIRQWRYWSCPEKALLDDVAVILKQILGNEIPPDTYQTERLLFGPGATLGSKAKKTTLLHKVDGIPDVTAGCLNLVSAFKGTLYDIDPSDFVITRGNRFATVPKSWKQLRGIAVEPLINTHFQRAQGLAIKRRLYSAGLKLEEVPSYNAEKLRSNSDAWATIDLKQASDSIPSEMVKWILPPIWFNHLAMSRCPTTNVIGEVIELEKWSSMGCGYTFELETAIFFAICRAVIAPTHWSDISVFGDDILVPREYGQQVVDALEMLGFVTNKDKTFLDGPFKESCGFDVWGRTDVRPIYLKKVPYNGSAKSYFHVVNTVRRVSLRLHATSPDRGQFRFAYKACLRWLPPDLGRMRGPDPYYLTDLLGCAEKDWSMISALVDEYVHDHRVLKPMCRFITKSDVVKYSNFSSMAQLIYAVTGGDPNGAPIRGTGRDHFLATSAS